MESSNPTLNEKIFAYAKLKTGHDKFSNRQNLQWQVNLSRFANLILSASGFMSRKCSYWSEPKLMKSKSTRSPEGRAVRRLRIKAGISQENLAQQVGVTTHTIWRLENKSSFSPRLKTLRAIGKALGVSLTDLLES